MACELAAAENSIMGVDRFSNLPDEIAQKIMSRFSFKDLACLGCVSKRCKELQLSTPFINLAVSRRDNVGNKLDSFNDFMIQRGDDKIKTFELSCSCVDIAHEKFQLSAWINSAVRCNVEELSVVLELVTTDDVLFTIPSALFVLGSLKSLKLDIECVIGGEVSFSPSLSNLESLDLSSVFVIDESFWRWISCSCKRLKNLSLSHIHGSKNIIIESSSLETFQFYERKSDCCNLSICANRLEDIGIHWNHTCSNNSVNIFAPKIKFFRWYGIFPSHLNLGEMRFLNEGCIYSNREVTELAAVVYILCRMRCVKTLQLTSYVLKALSKDGFRFAPLNEVRCLEVQCRDLTDALVPGLVHLLQRTPSLECLCLYTLSFALKANKFKDAHYDGRFDMEFWKQQKLAIVDCLKNIAIALDGGSNAFEFARYILKHARNLERMDIFCVPDIYDEVMELQDEMISSGTLIFHQVKEDEHFKMLDFLMCANW